MKCYKKKLLISLLLLCPFCANSRSTSEVIKTIETGIKLLKNPRNHEFRLLLEKNLNIVLTNPELKTELHDYPMVLIASFDNGDNNLDIKTVTRFFILGQVLQLIDKTNGGIFAPTDIDTLVQKIQRTGNINQESCSINDALNWFLEPEKDVDTLTQLSPEDSSQFHQ